MRLILPPSETKRDGGDPDAALDLSALAFPTLTAPRTTALRALTRLGRNLSTMSDALHLGPSQRHELLRNRALRSSPTMPALDRYTGVLFDALDAATLGPSARRSAASCVLIHSALFGLLHADDPIPAYRLSHDSRLPEVRLGAQWRAPLGAVLAAHSGMTLDLRSEAYAALGPVPRTSDSFFLRVVAEGADGRRRALNHFNKHGKGALVRLLLETGGASAVEDGDGLIEWAREHGIRLSHGAPGELELVVDQMPASRRDSRSE